MKHGHKGGTMPFSLSDDNSVIKIRVLYISFLSIEAHRNSESQFILLPTGNLDMANRLESAPT